jgi:hypothetical protein
MPQAAPRVSWNQGREHHDGGGQDHQCRDEELGRTARAALGPPVPVHPVVTVAIVQTPDGGLPRSAPAPNGTQTDPGPDRRLKPLTAEHVSTPSTKRRHSRQATSWNLSLTCWPLDTQVTSIHLELLVRVGKTCDYAAKLGFHCALVRVVGSTDV